LGPDLADGIVQGQAQGNQFRSTPLWGVSFRRFLLHDGRATTIDQAVNAHGGESAGARFRFRSLRPAEHDAPLAFLGTI
jgi:CxxC motif-containing protein (DUF1111 family)